MGTLPAMRLRTLPKHARLQGQLSLLIGLR